MFTKQNTQGFTQEQLDLLNQALEIMMARGYDESHASDLINNRWVGDETTLADLTK
ncbi:Uncharacterized protein ChrSV_2373 [Chromobacterium vaccinii]|nr:Uncharacterized protein ChrSW_2373 [Chromobacterium vaccinii]QND89830.1 Uncharacterized protein ChrSV_2373 [Chromobacterium vaccinii]